MQLKDAVITEEERQCRLIWRVGIVEELLQGKDGQIRGDKVRNYKTNSILERPVNKLYLIERTKETINKVDNEEINITDERSMREAEVLEEIKQKLNS